MGAGIQYESRQREVVYASGEPIDGECVEFHLLYSGNGLRADSTSSQKHTLRRAFHPQLKQLWKSDSRLRKLAILHGLPHLPVVDQNGISADDLAQAAYFNNIGNRYARGKFRFVPLVEEETCLRVSIDILFLRPDQHPLIKQGGDIDNRLKHLFDAFRVPDTTDGLGGAPDLSEDPFFVFLHDDSLISEIRVSTGNLLMLPQTQKLDAKETFLVINVKLKPKERTAFSVAFE